MYVFWFLFMINLAKNTHKHGVLVGPHFGGAAAELEERDQSKWEFERKYHLHCTNSSTLDIWLKKVMIDINIVVRRTNRGDDDESSGTVGASDNGNDEARSYGDGPRQQIPSPCLHFQVQETLSKNKSSPNEP